MANPADLVHLMEVFLTGRGRWDLDGGLSPLGSQESTYTDSR
jgi:hypothetical protein